MKHRRRSLKTAKQSAGIQPTALPCPRSVLFSRTASGGCRNRSEVVRLSSTLSQRGRLPAGPEGHPSTDEGHNSAPAVALKWFIRKLASCARLTDACLPASCPRLAIALGVVLRAVQTDRTSHGAFRRTKRRGALFGPAWASVPLRVVLIGFGDLFVDFRDAQRQNFCMGITHFLCQSTRFLSPPSPIFHVIWS